MAAKDTSGIISYTTIDSNSGRTFGDKPGLAFLSFG